MNYYIKTYGCQMNEYDSERVCSALESMGYKSQDNYKNCDLVLVNTCSIREKADDKLFSELGRIYEEKEKMQKAGKYTIIVVSGCVPETAKESIFKRAPYVDIILGPQSYFKLKDMINEVKSSFEIDKKTGFCRAEKKHLMHLDFSTTEKFDFLNEERKNFNGTTAYISVQEGCDKFCTYCVVPNTRGREVSRGVEDIIKEARRVAALGAKEIMFLGQNITGYRAKDSSGKEYKLSDLIYDTAKIDGIERIKYTTSHPMDMDDDIINIHRDIPKLTPYLHLPVQSGSNNILKKMNRKYTKELYIDLIQKFRNARPDIVFSSDFIVGFPGETEEDFEETMDLIKKVRYDVQCYSFAYSERPGTVATTMKGRVEPVVRNERLLKLQKLLEDQKTAFSLSKKDQILSVLFDASDTKKSNQIAGRSQFGQIVVVDLPENMDRDLLINTIKNVKITSVGRNSLRGEL